VSKKELVALRDALDRARRTVEHMGMADLSRWSAAQRVEFDLAYTQAKACADAAMEEYYYALSAETVAQTVAAKEG
jgi:hypothetical protein